MRSEDAALLFGPLLIAVLLLPSGFEKLMTISTFPGSLTAKGCPIPFLLLVRWLPQIFRSGPRCLPERSEKVHRGPAL
jgi:uncharacterized membrane protein YphA (DoxX/SURF4 family)